MISLPDAFAAARRLGQQRFAMTHCMTCANLVRGWATWEADPVMRFQRELVAERGRLPPGQMSIQHAELRAIADLILAHRDEFDERVRDYRTGHVVTMSELRKRRNAR